MRSLEYLLQSYPNKTGKELIEMQELDKIEDQLEFEKINKHQLDLIDDINTNGGFYKGRFGMSQHFYYKFTNLMLDNGQIYCDVKNIVAFFDPNSTIKIEVDNKEYQKLDRYGISIYDRVTEEEFNKVLGYLNVFKAYWDEPQR